MNLSATCGICPFVAFVFENCPVVRPNLPITNVPIYQCTNLPIYQCTNSPVYQLRTLNLCHSFRVNIDDGRFILTGVVQDDVS